MLRLSKVYIACFLFVFIISSSAYAKKPIKLTDAEMENVQGAVVPIGAIIVAAAGPYALAVTVDLISAQYDYFTNNPDAVDSIVAVVNPLQESNDNDVEEMHKWGRYTGDKNIEAMSDPVNIIAGLTAGVGEGAGMCFKGATGSVKVGQTGKDALKPFVLGAGKEALQQGAETAFEAPASCLAENNYSFDNSTHACVTENILGKASDPLTWLGIASAGIVRGEAYNVRSGRVGSQLKRASDLNTAVEAIGIGKDVLDDFSENSFDSGAENDPYDWSSVSNAENYMCIAPSQSDFIEEYLDKMARSEGGINISNNHNNKSSKNRSRDSERKSSSNDSNSNKTSNSKYPSSNNVKQASKTTIKEISQAAKKGSVNDLSDTAKAVISSRL